MHQLLINTTLIELVQGDITTQSVDAIVNAANSHLGGGSVVNGAIQRAAGPALLAECATLGGCATGQAKLTQGYRLPARYVIHAVGPVYRGGQHDEAALLAAAYHNSLRVADIHGVRSLALPAISTGVYSYPLDEAAQIALTTVRDYLRSTPTGLTLVRFVLFGATAATVFGQALAAVATAPDE